MTSNVEITEQFFQAAKNRDLEKISNLVSEDIDWFIAGNVELVPWIGKKIGKQGVKDFYKGIYELLVSEKFEIQELMSSNNRVCAIGYLESRVRKTNKLIKTEFIFDFLFDNHKIIRSRLFEDSYAVSKAVES